MEFIARKIDGELYIPIDQVYKAIEDKDAEIENIKTNFLHQNKQQPPSRAKEKTMERELTALEHRLYKFLDDMDTILENEVSPVRWERMRDKMRKCKEDCKLEYGVVNNGYSLHIQLPFDINKHTRA